MSNRILNIRFLENGHPWVDGQEQPVTLDEIEEAISTLKAARMLWSVDQYNSINDEYEAYIGNNDATYGDERGSAQAVNDLVRSYGRSDFPPSRPNDEPVELPF